MTLVASLAVIVGVAIGLLWGCGLLVARPFLPQRYRPLLPLIAPFLGVSLVSAVAHYAGTMGVPLRSLLWLFVGLAGAGWAVVLLDRRWRRFPRSSAPALAICSLAFLLALGPLLSLGYLTTVGGTIDAVSYAVRSEYLRDAPLVLPEIEAGKPYLGWVRLQLFLRAGDVYLVGLLSMLTGKRSYELLTVVPALFFALTAGSVYVLARLALGFRRWAALLAAALVAVHNLLLWPVYDNFLSQALALGFLPLVLAVGIEGQRRPRWRTAALFAVLFSGLVSIYPVFAICALAAVLCVWVLAWLLSARGARGRALGRAALWWLGALSCSLLWNGSAFARLVAELEHVSNPLTRGGNILVFPPAVELLGLISHAAAVSGNAWKGVPLPALNILGLLFAGLAVYGWWRLRPQPRLAAAALLLTSAVLIAQQRWGAHFPYGYFKVLTTAVAEVMLLVAAGIAALWHARRPALRGLAGGAALLLLVINLKHTLGTQSYVLKTALMLDRDLIDIGRAASGVEPDAWVLLDMKTGLRQQWLGYLIRERKIRFREPLWFGDVDTPGAANAFFRYAVVERELDEQRRGAAFGEPWYDSAGYVQLRGNSRYELRERRDLALASVRWDRRWPERSALALAVAPPGSLSVQLGPEVKEGSMGPGVPRTVQVRLYSLAPSGELAMAALGGPLTLGPGGWLLDFDLGCVPDGRIGIDHAGGDAVLLDVRVLGTATGPPGVCLEKVALPTGIAYFEQDDLGNGRVRLRAVLLRPEGAGARAYRLGFHIIEISLGKMFGVWSLDFPTDERIRHGSIELNLRDRSSHGEIDGRPVSLELSNFDHGQGSFEAAAVWWQFHPLEQLRIEPMLWFERTGEGSVEVVRTAPAARLRVLSVP